MLTNLRKTHRLPNPVHNPSQSMLSLHMVWIVKHGYKRLKNITYSEVANFKHTVHKDISLFKKNIFATSPKKIK